MTLGLSQGDGALNKEQVATESKEQRFSSGDTLNCSCREVTRVIHMS